MAGEIQLDHDSPVYAKPRSDSRVLTTLKAGSKMQVSDSSTDGFRKVRVGGGQNGYISDDDLAPIEPLEPLALKSRPYILGLYGATASLSQGSKSFMTTDQVQYQTAGYSGSAPGGGFFIEHRYADSKAYRIFLGYEMLRFTGQATEVGIPIAPLQVNLNESFITIGGDWKYYPLVKWDFWLGIGAEYARGLTVQLQLNGVSDPTSEEDLANLFFGMASTGWDFHFGEWFLSPSVRVGDAPFARPSIFMYEISLEFGHSVSF